MREISALRRFKRGICDSQGFEFDSTDHKRAKKLARKEKKNAEKLKAATPQEQLRLAKINASR